MHNVLTQGLLIKLYADIVELRNNFLLPVNVDASEFKSEDDHLHQGLFLSEQVELVKADSEEGAKLIKSLGFPEVAEVIKKHSL